jgi:hypothetical protein
VEFYLVYIQEAHASDGWQTESNEKEKVIYDYVFEGEGVDQALPDAVPNAQVEIIGDWKTAGEGKEIISPLPAKKAGRSHNGSGANQAQTEYVDVTSGGPLEGAPFPVAPIRTTSPGLTVYRGGAYLSVLDCCTEASR